MTGISVVIPTLNRRSIPVGSHRNPHGADLYRAGN